MRNSKAVVLTAALLLMVMLFSACSSVGIDYKEDDMGQYVTLDQDAYNNAEIEVYKQPVVDDEMIRSQILTNVNGQWTWAKAKAATSVYVKNKAIAENENALVFMHFYTVNEDGEPLKGGSSFVKVDSKDTVSNDPSAYLIGAGSAQALLNSIDGFGEKLWGIDPSKTSFKSTTGTEIKDDSVVYLTTKATYTEPGEDGKATTVTYDAWTMTNARIDLANIPDDLKALLDGTGDEDFLKLAKENKSGKSFKMTKKNQIDIEGTSHDVTITATVNYVVEDQAIQVTLPKDYSDKDLQGKNVTVYVTVDGFMNFKDVASKLGHDGAEFKAEDAEDEDEASTEAATQAETTLFEAYYAHVKKELDESYENTLEANKRNAVWNYLFAEAKFENIPFEVVTAYYDEALENYHWQYQNGSYYGIMAYSDMYATFEKMMIAFTGSNNWEDALHEDCEVAIQERILLHYLADDLKLTVTEKEVKAALKDAGLDESSISDLSDEEMLGYEESLLWDKVTEKLCGKGYITIVEVEEEEDEADTDDKKDDAETDGEDATTDGATDGDTSDDEETTADDKTTDADTAGSTTAEGTTAA